MNPALTDKVPRKYARAALSVGELTAGLTGAGFEGVLLDPTHRVADEMFAASITARKSPA